MSTELEANQSQLELVVLREKFKKSVCKCRKMPHRNYYWPTLYVRKKTCLLCTLLPLFQEPRPKEKNPEESQLKENDEQVEGLIAAIEELKVKSGPQVEEETPALEDSTPVVESKEISTDKPKPHETRGELSEVLGEKRVCLPRQLCAHLMAIITIYVRMHER